MKNLSRLFSLVFLIGYMALTAPSFAQSPAGPSKIPFTNFPYEAYSQMWNANSTTWYYGTVVIKSGSKVPTGSNVGSQIDTAASGTNMKLTTSSLSSGSVNVDTVLTTPIPGYGNMVIKASLLNTAGSGTTTVVSTLASSSDGFVWSPVLSSLGTAFTFTSVVTSSVTPTVVRAALSATQVPGDRYYQWQFTGDGAHPYSAQAWWYWQGLITSNR